MSACKRCEQLIEELAKQGRRIDTLESMVRARNDEIDHLDRELVRARQERDEAIADAAEMAEWLECYPGTLPARLEDIVLRRRRQ